jgi:hypothetical protein
VSKSVVFRDDVLDAREMAARLNDLQCRSMPDIPFAEACAQIVRDASRGQSAVTEVPSAFTLFPNYPDPFNPYTVIPYEVKEAGVVRLRVFDALGRIISELEKKMKQPGSYTATFDARTLPSGMYIYSLEMGGTMQTGTMLLVR